MAIFFGTVSKYNVCPRLSTIVIEFAIGNSMGPVSFCVLIVGSEFAIAAGNGSLAGDGVAGGKGNFGVVCITAARLGEVGMEGNGGAGLAGSMASDTEQLIDVAIQSANKREMDTICSFLKDIFNLGYSFLLRSKFMDRIRDSMCLHCGLIWIKY